MTVEKWLLPILLAALPVAAPPVPGSVGGFHLELEKSDPSDGASVEAVSEVRLWFTQVPQEGTTSIRVLDEAGEPVAAAGRVVQDDDDERLFSVSLPDGLSVGPYTVAWRAMGSDGHVVRGEVSFRVTAP